MTEREVVAAALAAVLGAVAAVAVPGWAVVAVVAVALLGRRPGGWMVALAVVASVLAARAEAGLDAGARGPVAGVASLVGDPEVGLGGRVTVDVSLAGHRYRAEAAGAAAAVLAPGTMGARVWVAGRVGDLSGPWSWRAAHHLAGALVVGEARPVDGGPWWWRGATAVRRTVARGLGSFDAEQRALFEGVVLGDDRGQSEVASHRFRAAGLSHLLAVSGQNVAFALLAVSPVVRRLPLRGRWVASMAVLAGFALVTRAEPSVLRASAMAAVAATAAWWGRAASGRRVLAVAVLVLVLVDPLLVWAVGFRLSVAATAALVALARPLEDAVVRIGASGRHVPRPVATAVAASLAATVGTAPWLLPLSGAIPAVGLVANLVAVPVAGALMVYGVVTAPIAGLVGGPVAAVLGWPSRLMVDGLALVARVATGAGVPWLGVLGVTGVVVAVVGGAVGDRLPGPVPVRWLVRVPTVAVAVGLALVALDATVGEPEGRLVDDRGVTVWRVEGAVVVALGATATERAALAAVAPARLRRVDLVVVLGGGLRTSGVVHALRQVLEVGPVVAARPETVRDAAPLRAGVVRVGSLALEVRRDAGGRWSVVGPDPPDPPDRASEGPV